MATRTAESAGRSRSKSDESQLGRINRELAHLGTDHLDNIRRLTALCGEILQGTAALYNRIEGGLLCSIATWLTPPDYNPKDRPDGHICYDVIRNGSEEVFVVRDLARTKYAKTDPNVKKFGLQTYIGRAVRFSGASLGSLCVVFREDRTPGVEEKHVLGVLASLVGVEEDRRREFEKTLLSEGRYRAFVENHEDAVCRWLPGMILTYTNARYNALFGSGGRSLVGRRWIEFVPAGELAATEAFYDELVRNPRVVSFEHDVVRVDGSVRRYRWTDIPMLDANGSAREFQSIGRDITHGKQPSDHAARE